MLFSLIVFDKWLISNMNDNIFFSIICPTYNSAKFIQRNINSLIRQNYKNFEVIYSDDGSTDETTNIILNNKKNFLIKKYNFPC